MLLFIYFSHYNINMRYFISFTRGELEALRLFDNFENINELATGLKKSKSQVYRILRKLGEKGVIENSQLVSLPYLKKLIFLIRKNKNLVDLFSDSGLPILLQLRKSMLVDAVAKELSLNEQTVYKTISKAREIGLVIIAMKKYLVNPGAWSEVLDFLNSLWEQEMSFDKRTPKNSIIYYKSEKEILFSTDESVNASFAAFSAFSKFGVNFLPKTNYYFLSKQKLTEEKVYEQALKVVEKNWDYRLLTILGIFALCNKISFDKKLVKEFQLIFSGREIDMMPLPKDFREKAKEYGLV
jgi:predicted transcriptional regulator